MAHKYIEDIIDLEDTPYGWSENTGRDSLWKEQRKIYGFDERETWSLDATFFYWLYERLTMFKKVCCIDLSFHKFTINNEVLTQGECIDKMLNNCKEIITNKGIDDLYDLKKETLEIWSECIFSMWW